jgi:hypothetical protein
MCSKMHATVRYLIGGWIDSSVHAYVGLVQCLLDCHRYRSAELVAQSMLRAVGQSGRAFMVVF